MEIINVDFLAQEVYDAFQPFGSPIMCPSTWDGDGGSCGYLLGGCNGLNSCPVNAHRPCLNLF